MIVDFQQKTADRIFEVFHNGQRRVLLADEVGLGKTIVAKEVIKRVSKWHKEELHDDHFKVVYICSNLSIAGQNARKLGIQDQVDISESRLSMQHLKIYENAAKGHAYEQLIPLTPATSFSMTVGGGSQAERALIYALIRRQEAFAGYKKKLKRFMAYDASAHWDEVVDKYESRVRACGKNGSNYLREMKDALAGKLANKQELVDAIKDNCDSKDPERRKKSMRLINQLRRIFAEISLQKLDPDLVIMDEFQRFRDLIKTDENTEEGMLSRQFLHNTKTKVLLLSATPYKPYSTLEEIAEDREQSDHYHEFIQVMDFLFHGEKERKTFHTVWQDYSSSLCQVNSDNLALLIAAKGKAEDILYLGICRTERFNTGIIDDKGVKEVELTPGDLFSYDAMQSLLDAIAEEDPKALRWRNVPVDYIKSSPYLLSFMEYYQLKEQISAFCLNHPEFLVSKAAPLKYLLLKKSQIHDYKRIPSNNARLEMLRKVLFPVEENGPELLLWIPASHPYYRTNSVFEKNSDFSKVLVFSSWEMVPRMVSVMVSYDAEQRTIGKLYNKASEHRGRGYFATEEEKRFGASRLKNDSEKIICQVSGLLADLYHPDEKLGWSLRELRKDIQAKLVPILDEMKQHYGIKEQANAGVSDLLECIRALDGDPSAHPASIPANAVKTLADMAIGSPAICAYRMLLRGMQDKPKAAGLASGIAKEVFVSMFNKPEASGILDLLYSKCSERGYYRYVFQYCAEGNLQAVLDEYAHVLDAEGEKLKEAIVTSTVDTVTLSIDMQENFPIKKKKEKNKMRCHFGVAYYNAKADDKAVVRVDRIRKSFNSPFRPFVLSTTSIGQEGLDFHCYCRKVMHWNLPSNPIDLEQREGRINRFKCLAVRQNIARKYCDEFAWNDMFEHATKDLKGDNPDLVPYWCLPDPKLNAVKIERIVPMYPFSQDPIRYDRIIKILSLYRLTLGQPRQEELISILDKTITEDQSHELFMNLSPYYH
ncbi:DEAD/DEAH box helicase family protein [Clostridiales bacterium]|nr:DEAD/DEAH box helicase family protein [Clostridiales bacterium]